MISSELVEEKKKLSLPVSFTSLSLFSGHRSLGSSFMARPSRPCSYITTCKERKHQLWLLGWPIFDKKLANMSTQALTQALYASAAFFQQWVEMRLSLFGGHSAVVQVLSKTLAITTPQLHQRASASWQWVTGSPVVKDRFCGHRATCPHVTDMVWTQVPSKPGFGTGCNSYPAPEAGYQIAQCVYLTSQSLQKSCLGWRDLLFHLLADHHQWYFTHCRAGGPRGASWAGNKSHWRSR